MNFIAVLFSSLIQGIPVHFAAKFFGGKSSYFRAVLLTILGTFIGAAVYAYFSEWAGLISFLLLLALYKVGFEIGWLRAFFVWILSIVLFFLLMLLFGLLLGITLISL